ncbi:PREDICTED: GABA transporter 1-like isoform X2 [Nelumbo nucifera]|uniref:GABA transporter 1-like isoform X2 n=1 Tax=Nelumbo nucifera TaxID=4432 RepID=A0A1U8AKD9_NELNU|nr:PREDICTED: GABA transporter 1-like isoform X2 [Nelumbo nucifera]
MGTVEAGLDYSSSDTQHHKELDAEALFVLKSRGSWLHCGYHLTTSIVAPALLSLPFAFALLGWVAGVSCLIIAVLVTFYSYNLLSKVLEHHAQLGQRQLRFRDMASDILGPRWGRYFVGPLQFSLCYAAVIACTLLGGQSLKFIYLLCNSSGTMKLYEFVAIFGVLMLILAQIPSFHSLRHINLISLTLCLAYSTCATIDSTYIGNSVNAPPKDSSVNGDGKDQLFGAFNAISIIATTYGNGIIPEIQATIAPPVEGKMFKGLCLCYAVVYLQPTNELVEKKYGDPKSNQFSIRKVVPRLFLRSLLVVVATILAAMFPFFGDINALIGAFGCIPLDFVLPMVFYNVTFKPSRKALLFWGNTAIAMLFSMLGVLGAISSVRQIVIDAKLYQVFANI